MIKSALFYKQNNLSVIATGENKRAIMAWKQYQTRFATDEELESQFAHPKAKGVAVICGAVSNNLEVIDIDLKNDVTGTLYQRLTNEIGSLISKLYIVKTKSGGYHFYYRCETIEGNIKLASRPATESEIKDNPHVKQVVLIETRGEGGYVIAPPTDGYERQNDFNIPVLTIDERDHLLSVCRSFNEIIETVQTVREYQSGYSKTPWQDFNERGDIVPLLVKHGWQVVNETSERVVFKRPGQTESKSSGDYHKDLKLFKVFTTSSQFEPGKGYNNYAVYAMLEHKNDFSKAAKELIKDGYGEQGGFIEKKISVVVNRLISAGHNKDRIIDVLTTEHNKPKREAEILLDEITGERGETIQAFWEVNETKSGKTITLQRHKLCEFLFNSGFHLFFYDKKSNIFRLVYQKDGFVQEATTEMIKKFVKNYIQSLPAKFDNITPNELLEIVMKGSDAYFGNGFLEFMDARNIDLLKDDATTAYFPFKNGIVKVDANGSKLLSYGDVRHVVWQSQVIDFDIDVDFDFAEDLCEFWKFMLMVSGNEQANVEYLMGLMGYLLHQYKDPSRPFAVILAEETEDEKKGGGTGKGILVKALSYMSNIERVDGKNFKLDKNFAFQRVGLDTKIIAIEDVRRNVDFEGFYSIITEGVTVEKKNKDELFIPYKDSPKILFTTNYTIPSTGDHAKRRQKVFEFSNAFSSKYTPIDHFGHKLFDDWDKDEWNRFYNLMFIAVAYYLHYGVKDIANGEKLKRKHIRLNFGEEFLDWWDNHVKENIGKWQPFKSLYNEFKIANDLESKDYSSKRFRKAIDEASERFEYQVGSRRTGSERINEICIERVEKSKNVPDDSIQKPF
jgi:hypothetical protein